MPFSNEILVQEYIPGQEFSVEALSISGRYFPWGVTMKFTTSGKARAETGHIFPAPISDILRDKILGIAEKAALALGITNGISHTEIKLDKNGEPRVIESCSRPAGDYIPRLVKLSTGEDPLEIYVKQAVGELHTDFSPAKPYCFSAIQFIRPNIDGKFVSINIPSVLSSAKIVDSRITVVENSHVQPGTTNIERLGWTIISADTADAIVGAMEELENSTRIFIE
ncbi:ATP-grasp domain-containing protein [Dickeya lacustris]|uniref:ATP-grasp domain-containing protein n=1 Tax=Dickeya lacustris TaxID=2259638 RepID=A0ABY8GCF3_9GAMM|nr:ATP-grasp domain-containing protein [Dickeya lacustris]WFN57635.1 ATP-grasp domain-containing protein [Dickeya lacustris]